MSERFADLNRLMLMARTRAQILQFVCIGAGDAFIERYWPKLRGEVRLGRISLLVADYGPLDELKAEKVKLARDAGENSAADRLEILYEQLTLDHRASDGTLHEERPQMVHYVDLKDPAEQSWLDRIRADVVFVLVPDQYHIRVARRWLKRATLIIIENPYDKEYTVAESFEQDLSRMLDAAAESTRVELPGTVVSPFDHYLAKIQEYIRDHATVAALLGPLKSVEFALLEPGPVERWRVEALSAGMIYDLFSHILAMLSVDLKVSTFDIQSRRTRIAVARHSGLEETDYKADTFATFDFTMETYSGALVDVHGAVGKGVGSSDMKHLTLIGGDSVVRFDLGRTSP
ncbi:MAG TPA: hypothetical protein VI685_06690, partial [Candidatus Angelobacter sp.]